MKRDPFLEPWWPRRMVVCARVDHYSSGGELFAFAPYAKEIDLWAELFEELAIVGTLLRETPPGDAAPFRGNNIRVIPVPPPTRRGPLGRLAGVLRILRTAGIIYSSIGSSDAVHVRCPCDLGLLGAMIGPLRSRFLFAKYAGDWWGSAVPLAWRLQRVLLRTSWWKGPVTIYGGTNNLPRKVVRIFNTTLSTNDLERGIGAALSRSWNGTLKILFVGRLTRDKEPMAVLQAVEELVAEGRDVRLTLVGLGPEQERICDYIRRDRELSYRVVVAGGLPLEAVFKAYEEAHCLVLASRTEGFPKVVFEAMAYGLVCIVSNTGELPSLLGDSGVLFVAPGNSRMIAEFLREFDADRAAARERGLSLQTRVSDFTLERLAVLFKEILHEAWQPLSQRTGGKGW